MFNINGNRKYLFKPLSEKLALLDKEDISVEEISLIIKALPTKLKHKELMKIFKNIDSCKLSFSDVKELFLSLPYNDKEYVIEKAPYDDYKKELLECMSSKDYPYLLYNVSMGNKEEAFIVSLLTEKQKRRLFKYPLIVSTSAKIEMLKYFTPEEIERVLKSKFGLSEYMCNSTKIELLNCLISDQNKLDCLKFPNKYNIEASEYDKKEILLTLSDEAKIKLVKEDSVYDVKITNYDKRKITMSLSSKGKLYYLNHPDEFEKIFTWRSCFFKDISEDISKQILTHINSYAYEFGDEDILTLIANLSVDERFQFLCSTNSYNISLTDHQKCDIICHLPDKYKLKFVSEGIVCDFKLGEDQIRKIIKSMKPITAIMLLVSDPDNKLNLSKKTIWDIIENLTQEAAVSILQLEREDVVSFVEKYKTSFVKCLRYSEKLEIICNKSPYNIHLDDIRKVKILRSISQYANLSECIQDNVFNYFDTPKIIVDNLIDDNKSFNTLHEMFQKQLVAYFMKLDINDEEVSLGLDVVKYLPNAKDKLTKFKLLKPFFYSADINIYDFFQYGINSNKYNWYDDILSILDNNKIDGFRMAKKYFFSNYYKCDNDSKNVVKNFLELLSVYHKYEDFCKNLAASNRPLTKAECEDIKFLFNRSNVYEVKNIEDIAAIRNKEIRSYVDIAENSDNLFTLKDALFSLLFDKSYSDMYEMIKYTGNTSDLKILQFNNKGNPDIKKLVDSLALVTSLIERIINIDSPLIIKKVLKFYSSEENVGKTKIMFDYCSKYEEYIRKLYEFDLKASMTNIQGISDELRFTEKALELSKKYSGDVIDLSETQYLLGAHVKSNSENIESLLNGYSDGKSNFICLSPVSHRGQYYYGYYGSKVIFAYDNIPDNSFICSSISNMGSNSTLKYNTSEIPTISRIQKDALETSEAYDGRNAEILLYRSKLKPCGIIIPSGTEISEEAIKYHKEYGLPFIITQPLDKNMENPKRIIIDKKELLDIDEIYDIQVLKELEEALIRLKDEGKKQVAVITDPHALYEPTLACLVDIKNKGIDEIYSLGDNIGHGPSPKEVIDLLHELGVKSIYGNHELYLVLDSGIEEFQGHFPSEESIARTSKMNEWMRTQLSEEDIEEIKKYPEKYELVIPNGEKITLIHTTRPYNNSGKYSTVPIIDEDSFVIRGHEHFASGGSRELTLRAVGIGQTTDDDGKATYAVIDDKGNVNIVNVEYNRDNLLHTINESSMPISAKSLIKDWVGTKKKTNNI